MTYFQSKAAVGFFLLLLVAGLVGLLNSMPINGLLMAQGGSSDSPRRVLGPVESVSEDETDIQFLARVDTGARTCSLHAAEKKVIDGSKFMEDNVGKMVRFRVVNREGEAEWLEREIAEVRKIRTSEGEETRYLVPLTLTCKGVEREVLASLNDRSRMSYTMLLGRNFLEGKFVVDVTGADEADKLFAGGL